MFKGFCAEVFYHASPYRLLWGISIFDAKITLRLYTEKNQPRYLTNQGQFIQEWTGGYSLLQWNLARNLFPTITLNHIITLCHHASFLTLRNEKNMDEGLTIYLFIHCKSPWHILRMGFGVWDQCRENNFFSKNTHEEEFEKSCKWQQSRYIYVLYIKHHNTQSLLVTWLSCLKIKGKY